MEKTKIQIKFNDYNENIFNKVMNIVEDMFDFEDNIRARLQDNFEEKNDYGFVIWLEDHTITPGTFHSSNKPEVEYYTAQEFLDKFKKDDNKKIILSNHAYEIYSELKRIVASGALRVPIFSFSYGGNILGIENFKDDMFKLSSELQDEDELPVFRSILGDDSIIVVEKKEEPKYILSYKDSGGSTRYFQLNDGCETYTYSKKYAEVFTSYHDAEVISLSTVYDIEEL